MPSIEESWNGWREKALMLAKKTTTRKNPGQEGIVVLMTILDLLDVTNLSTAGVHVENLGVRERGTIGRGIIVERRNRVGGDHQNPGTAKEMTTNEGIGIAARKMTGMIGRRKREVTVQPITHEKVNFLKGETPVTRQRKAPKKIPPMVFRRDKVIPSLVRNPTSDHLVTSGENPKIATAGTETRMSEAAAGVMSVTESAMMTDPDTVIGKETIVAEETKETEEGPTKISMMTMAQGIDPDRGLAQIFGAAVHLPAGDGITWGRMATITVKRDNEVLDRIEATGDKCK